MDKVFGREGGGMIEWVGMYYALGYISRLDKCCICG